MHRIIKRREVKDVKKLGPWVWIVGRRKTGKTFFVKNFLNYDEYFFVRKDNTIMAEDGSEISLDEFFGYLKASLGQRKIVIDEFHRLPQKFFEYLHMRGIQGELIAISSSLLYVKKFLGSGSPLFGLFSTLEMGLIDERDILMGLSKSIKDPRELIEASVYLREPILIPKYNPPLREFLTSLLYWNRLTIQEILLEIFEEEHRRLTEIYKAIFKSISDGKNISTEIASELSRRNLIKENNPGYLQRYLDVLVKIGMLEKIEEFGKEKYRYFNLSPLFDLHFYLDAKYNYTEFEISKEFIKDVINEKLPKHVEQFFRNLLSKIFGMKPVIINYSDLEIDVALVKFQKLKVVGEVKWVKNLDKDELRKAEKKLNKFKDCKRILIVPNKNILPYNPKEIEIWDVKKILEILKKGL